MKITKISNYAFGDLRKYILFNSMALLVISNYIEHKKNKPLTCQKYNKQFCIFHRLRNMLKLETIEWFQSDTNIYSLLYNSRCSWDSKRFKTTHGFIYAYACVCFVCMFCTIWSHYMLHMMFKFARYLSIHDQ